MKLNKVYLPSPHKPIVLVVLTALLVFGCFDGLNTNQAKIIINLGGNGSSGRAAKWPDHEKHNELTHEVIFSNSAEQKTYHAEKGKSQIEAVVAAGTWDITVHSFYNNTIYAKGVIRATLIAGQDNIILIPMKKAFLVTFYTGDGGSAVEDQYIAKDGVIVRPGNPKKVGHTFDGWYQDVECKESWNFEMLVTQNITLYAKWNEGVLVEGGTIAAKLRWLERNAENNGDYILVLNKDESLSWHHLSYGNKTVKITLKSDSEKERILQKSGTGNMFVIDYNVTFVLEENVTLKGVDKNNSTLIASYGTFIMNGGTIMDNKAAEAYPQVGGGGVDILAGTFTMNNGIIKNNTAAYGGGVYVNNNGVFTIENGTIENNYAKISGGGIEIAIDAEVTMKGGTISGNRADVAGGGIKIGGKKSSFTLINGTISNNESKNAGGISVNKESYSVNPSFTMKGGIIKGNTASDYAGGVDMSKDATFIMTDGTISNNKAKYCGGVSIHNGSTFTMSGGTISHNTAYEHTGGIQVVIKSNFTMSGNADISYNRASTHGGGVVLSENASFTMSGNAVVSFNVADQHGGGVLVGNNSTFTMNSGTISENHAIHGAGVGVDQASRFIMEGGTITKNIASEHGGGVSAGHGSTFTMNGGTVSENEATIGGGVNIDLSAIFTLNKGTISGNITTDLNSGGVDIRQSIFTKTGGIIYGNEADKPNANTIRAIRAADMSWNSLYKNKTVDEYENLYYNGNTTPANTGNPYDYGTWE